jgi:hypothetical protein
MKWDKHFTLKKRRKGDPSTKPNHLLPNYSFLSLVINRNALCAVATTMVLTFTSHEADIRIKVHMYVGIYNEFNKPSYS